MGSSLQNRCAGGARLYAPFVHIKAERAWFCAGAEPKFAYFRSLEVGMSESSCGSSFHRLTLSPSEPLSLPRDRQHTETPTRLRVSMGGDHLLSDRSQATRSTIKGHGTILILY
ncbi:hypothetical protein EVAR_94607_1 [Eumeta japonica]|uniref:Uncharacterized protein n=1 Tax=Eumeta variegata TaxID=151549 RepID=A0A4C1UUR9_EUMVA|nr:hypothetical protein EVAR_94607_1 [Eumeta japonica]